MEKIRYRLAGLAFMWPQVSFSLRDDSVGQVILQTHKCNSIAASFSTIFPVAKSRNLSDVSIDKDEFKISGIVSTDSYSRKDLQFVFVNKRLILKSSIHHQINKIFGRSLILRKKGLVEGSENVFQNGSPTKQGERFAIFAINVICPFDCYDITFDPQKTLVEFTNWPKLIHLLQDMLYGFFRRENLLSISDFSSFIDNDMKQDDESGSSCDEINFSESTESSVNVLEKFIRKADGYKNEANTLQSDRHNVFNSDLQNNTFTRQRSHDLFGFSTVSEDSNASDEWEMNNFHKSTYILETDLSCDTDPVKKTQPISIFGCDELEGEQVLDSIPNGHKNNVNEQHITEPQTKETLQNMSSEANSKQLLKPSLPKCPALHNKVVFETPLVVDHIENETEDVLTVLNKEQKPKPVQKITLGKLSNYTSTLQKIRGNNKDSLKEAGVVTSTLQQLRTSSQKAVQCLGDMYKTPVQKVLQDSRIDCQIPATEVEQIEPEQTQINVTLPELHEPQGSRMFKATIENRSLGQNDRKLCLKRLQNETMTHATKLAKLMKGEKGGGVVSTVPAETSTNFLQTSTNFLQTSTNFLQTYSFKKVRPRSPTALQKEKSSCQVEQIIDSSSAVKNSHCLKASSTFMSRIMKESVNDVDNNHVMYEGKRPENNESCKIRQKLLCKPSCEPRNNVPVHKNILNNSSLAVRDEFNMASKTSDFLVDLVSSPPSSFQTATTRLSCADPPDTASSICAPSFLAQSGGHFPHSCVEPAFSFSEFKQRKVHQDVMLKEQGDSRLTLVSSEQMLIDGTTSKIPSFKNRDIEHLKKMIIIAFPESNDQGTNRNLLEQDECSVTKQRNDQIKTNSSLCTLKMQTKPSEKTTLKQPLLPNKEMFSETIPTSSIMVPRKTCLQHVECPHSPEKKLKSCQLFGVKFTGLENVKFHSGRIKEFSLPKFNFRPNVNEQTVNEDICEPIHLRDAPVYDIEPLTSQDISHSKPACDLLNNKEGQNTMIQKNAPLQMDLTFASQPFEKELNIDISKKIQHLYTESSNVSQPKDKIHAINQASSSIEDLTCLHPTQESESNLGKVSITNAQTAPAIENVISDKVSVENHLRAPTSDCVSSQTLGSKPAQFVNGSQNPDVSKMIITVSDCTESEASRNGTLTFNNSRIQLQTHPLSALRKSVAFSNLLGRNISEKASTLVNISHGSDEEVNKLTSAAEMVHSGPTLCESPEQIVKKASTPVEQDNNDLQVKEGQCWKELTDDYSGNKMYVNMKSGHTVSKSQWPNVPASEDQNVQDNGEAIGQLSGSQIGCLQNIVISCMDQERAEAESKWKEGEKPLYEKNQGTNVSSIIAQWNNPVFLNYKSPTLNVETCPPGQTARSCYNSQNMLEFTKDMLKNVKVVGQLDKKFIACLINTKGDLPKGTKDKDGTLLVLFDQHAVHERIRLEQLTQESYEIVEGVKKDQMKKSSLPEPLLMGIDPDDLRIMKTFKQEFIRIGIDFTPDPTCRNKVYIDSVPCCVAEKSATDSKRLKLQSLSEKIENLISEHIEFLKSTNGTCGRLPLSLHRILCSQACHGAVKFGDQLSTNECENLLTSLAFCDLPFQCAHGRPSIAPLVNLAAIDEELANSRSHPKLWKISQRIGY